MLFTLILSKFFKNTSVLDTGARGATNSFVQRELGDVLLAWENEAWLARQEFGTAYEIVYPSVSVLAEPPVSVVDSVVAKKGTRDAATASWPAPNSNCCTAARKFAAPSIGR